MSDFEKCLNRLKLDIILIWVNFSCELGANNNQIKFPRGWMGDFEQYSN